MLHTKPLWPYVKKIKKHFVHLGFELLSEFRVFVKQQHSFFIALFVIIIIKTLVLLFFFLVVVVVYYASRNSR